MSVNGMGFRAVGSFGVALRANRVKGVHHATVISWLKQVGEHLPDRYALEIVPESVFLK